MSIAERLVSAIGVIYTRISRIELRTEVGLVYTSNAYVFTLYLIYSVHYF